jgi:ABC-type transport system substrate-binding protein
MHFGIKCGLVRLVLLSSVTLILGSKTLIASSSSSSQEDAFKYIITETSRPSSFDPLNADGSQNLPVMRMLYSTPLEVSTQDQLTSRILDKFSYEPLTKTMTWQVKKGVQYEDGSTLTPDDVVLAITRMAANRPLFPVIRNIKGVLKWSKQKNPLLSLPEGIKVDGSTITISLDESVDHPLFRFCLELFSVIPAKCVDKKSGQLLCDEPPPSGLYKVLSRDTDGLLFKKRSNVNDQNFQKAPEIIQFVYRSPEFLVKSPNEVGPKTVVASSEHFFTTTELELLRKSFQIQEQAKSRFTGFILNPDIPPFNNQLCRQVFAKAMRIALGKQSGRISPVEGSISPKMVSGYVPLSQLESEFGPSPQDQERCVSAFKKNPIVWGVIETKRVPQFETAVRQALMDLGLPVSDPYISKNRDSADEEFLAGKFNIGREASGLWPLDPFGDIQMLFTPGLHKGLYHLQKDNKLQDLIALLRMDGRKSERQKIATELNKYMFQSAVYNVWEHVGRFYVSRDQSLAKNLPLSITSPMPWQVFNLE